MLFRMFVFAVTALLAGCQTNTRKVQLLPAYQAAIAEADRSNPKVPKIFIEGMTSSQFWDELVPFCMVNSSRDGTTSSESSIRQNLRAMISSMPDVMLYAEGQTQQVGAVSTYIGFGVTTSSPVYAVPSQATGYRVAKATLPFRWNHKTGMVTLVRDVAAAGGLIEGDTLLLLGEDQASNENPASWVRSPIHVQRILWRPGGTVKAVWIRPGQGRMSGTVRLLENERSFLRETSYPCPDIPPIKLVPDASGQPIWTFDEPPANDYY